MSLIPELERTLVDAAVREPRRRRRALLRVVALPAAAAPIIGAVVALGVGGARDEAPPSKPAQPDRPAIPCPIGQSPSRADRWRRLDLRPPRSLTVLGCGRLSDGRQVELVARRLRGGHVCFDVYLPSATAALECAAGPMRNERAPSIAVTAFAPPGRPANRLGGRPLVTGWATASVARVDLRYRARASDHRLRLTLIRVRDRPLVLKAGQREPFGVFAFLPPSRMFDARLRGYDANGRRLTRALLPGALVPLN